MDRSIEELASDLARRAIELSAEDPALRGLIRELAGALLVATEESPPAVEAPPAEAPAPAPPPPTAPVIESTAPRESAAELAARITLGKPAPAGPPPDAQVGSHKPQVGASIDLRLVEQRCRLKAEGSRWAEKRRKLIIGGADFHSEVQPTDEELLDRARDIHECYLWMCRSDTPDPPFPNAYEMLAGCYDTVVDAVAHARGVEEASDSSRDDLEQALDLLAEAQSALRALVKQIDPAREDRDQKGAYNWLYETTRERQIYIKRHMRLDDPASPENWRDLAARLERLVDEYDGRRKLASRRRKLLGKVAHKASLIESGEEVEESWKVLFESVDELVEGGLPPSDRQLREAILPVVDDAPEDAGDHKHVEAVFTEVDRFLSITPPVRQTQKPKYNSEVATLRQKIAGKSLVLIGGERRPDADQKLCEAFGLEELYWISTRPHESTDRFKPCVARPDVAVVAQLIRFSSHSYGEVLKFCQTNDKPFVRLKGGYNPNQVAAQVLEQCSEQL